MAGSSATLLLRLLLFSSTLLLAFAQSGFLSIDCGANTSYVDSQTEIKWVPDGNYTSSGLNAKVDNQSVSKAVRTLRYFPNGNGSNCYAMPVKRGQRYFFRAMFLYGNYDGKNYWPSFSLSFDGGNWTHQLVGSDYISNQTVTVELIFPPKQTTTADLCLTTVDSVNNVPFISSLELRPLPARFYNQRAVFGNAYLRLTLRRYFNPDGNAIVRYPHDKYDRKWFPRSYVPDYANRITIGSNVTINTTGHGNEPPIAVLRTALEGKNDSVFNYTISMGEINSDLLFFFYFSELRYRKTTDVREFNMVVSNDNGVSSKSLTIKIGPNATLSGFFWGQKWGTSTDATFTFSLVPTTNSTLPPILNAFEIFRYNEEGASQGSSPPPPSQPPPSPPMSNPPPPPPSPPPPPPQQSSIQNTRRPTLCFIIALTWLLFVT